MSKQPAPILRPAAPEDSALLTAIAMTAKAHWGYDRAFMEACRAELTITPARIRTEQMKVAEYGGKAAGFYAFSQEHSSAAGEVEDVFVLPDFMGAGIGRALVEEMQAHARQHGLSSLEVDADPHAVTFYERMGFRRIGSSPSSSIPGRSLPRLRLQLDERHTA